MTKADLRRMISKASENGYGDWSNEWAVKLYIYPLASALTTTSEWERITDAPASSRPAPDGSVIQGTKNVNWLIKTIGERLLALCQELQKEIKKGIPANHEIYKTWKDEFYLDVSTYGLIYNDGGKIKSCSVIFNVTETEVHVYRQRGWKPLVENQLDND